MRPPPEEPATVAAATPMPSISKSIVLLSGVKTPAWLQAYGTTATDEVIYAISGNNDAFSGGEMITRLRDRTTQGASSVPTL